MVSKPLLRQVRRVGIAVVGGGVLLAGLALLALPGPGLLVTALGLTILGSEFRWIKRLQRRMERETRTALRQAQGRHHRQTSSRPRPRVDHPSDPRRKVAH